MRKMCCFLGKKCKKCPFMLNKTGNPSFFTTFHHMSKENFEYKNAMERLEAILTRIDNSEMEIDELAENVQEATALVKKCRQILLDTEKSVQGALESLDGEADA